MKSDEKSPPAEAGGPLDRSIRLALALAALLAGLLLAALLSALTARFLLLLAGFLLAALLTALTALLPALIWIVRHWKRLLIAG
jgi:tetrahydromethanopterin S-methyltransferase subunit D